MQSYLKAEEMSGFVFENILPRFQLLFYVLFIYHSYISVVCTFIL